MTSHYSNYENFGGSVGFQISQSKTLFWSFSKGLPFQKPFNFRKECCKFDFFALTLNGNDIFSLTIGAPTIRSATNSQFSPNGLSGLQFAGSAHQLFFITRPPLSQTYCIMRQRKKKKKKKKENRRNVNHELQKFMMMKRTLADLGGARDERPHSGSKLFHFHEVFGKNLTR